MHLKCRAQQHHVPRQIHACHSDAAVWGAGGESQSVQKPDQVQRSLRPREDGDIIGNDVFAFN